MVNDPDSRTSLNPSDQTVQNAPPTRLPSDVAAAADLESTVVRKQSPAAAAVPEIDAQPLPGQRLGDFFLIETLGAGSFATVYLATQVSLNRQVALKVARNANSEARTLANLEHEHIVPVFSESIDTERNLRLLCMKFVAGTTLERVLRELGQQPPERWNGQSILDAIDKLNRHSAMFDLAALRDRDRLADGQFIEAVCWIGGRVAEAMAHAHSRGVLHRDIKPANILLNPYGRPMLSDFNLAASPQLGQGGENFGGTLRYMAPEHLDAFLPHSGVTYEMVDERSDVYSLGVVLYEFLTGQPLFNNPVTGRLSTPLVRELAEQRRSIVPSPRAIQPRVPEVVDRVVRRCLEPDPRNRYQRAEELVQALDGCRHLQHWERDFPPALRLTRLSQQFPISVLLILIFLPHVLGSLVNITYNTFAIVNKLGEPQQQAFQLLLLIYNAIVYPVLLWIGCRVVIPIIRMRQRISGPERVEAPEVNQQRLRAVRLPGLLIVLSCLGWLPGALLFPLGIQLLAGGVTGEVFMHFLVSFTISGLIATTYSFLGVQVFVLRILYPSLWIDPQRPRHTAREELKSMGGRLRFFQFTAGLIPLTGAILVLGVSTEEKLSLEFRFLILGLIGMGMAGFGVALVASSRITQTLAVMLGMTRVTSRSASASAGASLSSTQPGTESERGQSSSS